MLLDNDLCYLYVTQEGDTFDSISLDYYDDERYAGQILQANPDYIDNIILPAGIVLYIPYLESQTSETLPPWQRAVSA